MYFNIGLAAYRYIAFGLNKKDFIPKILQTMSLLFTIDEIAFSAIDCNQLETKNCKESVFSYKYLEYSSEEENPIFFSVSFFLVIWLK